MLPAIGKLFGTAVGDDLGVREIEEAKMNPNSHADQQNHLTNSDLGLSATTEVI